ncbi:T9SS type A sorting domain-containing protein [Christiangramia echinicola]|nr:T9SS type A sorting domain-containing protein [Christiangramia echinicola]
MGTGVKAQTDIPLTDVVKANFGIEADVYANVNEIIDNALYDGTDDWFEDLDQWPGDGRGIIDVSSAAALALIAQWEVDDDDNVAGELRQSLPIYTTTPDERIWIDAVYGRDQRTNGSLSDMSFFTVGDDKNFQDPETWSIGTGSGGPQKNDIIEFVGHLRRDNDGTDSTLGTEYAIFGASTRSQNGTSHLDFELFRAPIELIGGNLVSEGTECNRTAYEFNPDGSVLTHGDVIFSVNYENGGDNVKVELYIWIDRTDFPNDAAFQAFNALSDNPFDFGSASGDFNFYECNTNPNYGYAQVSLVSALSEDWVTAQINEIPVTGPPWGTYNSGGNLVEDFPTLAFIEISLNATALGLDTGTTSGSCQNPLGSVIVKTRSSASFTAELKDLSGPYQLGDTPEVDVTLADQALNCTIDFVTLTANVLQDGTYKYEWFEKVGENDYDPIDTPDDQNELQVSEPGIYKVKVTRIFGDGSEGCFDEDEAEVTGTNDAPELVTTCPDPETVSCEDDVSSTFDTWLNTFDVSGGGGTVTSTYTVIIDGGVESDPIDFANWPEGIVEPDDVCGGGSITISLNASDECTQGDDCSSTFTLEADETIPVLDPAPEDITVECIEDVPAMISLAWTDNCDDGGSVLGEDSELVGGACGGTITRTWNVMDECGNPAATQTQIITVDDTTAPVIEDAPEDITVECIEDVPAMISLAWTDNCDDGGSVLGEDSELVGGACGGTITRTWNVMDECGNPAATQTQIITVDDTTAPVIEDAPEDITVECIEDVPTMISLAWTDNCDDGGSVLGEDSELVGGACGGTITRTWNVMDECGNPAATQTQIITVDDTTAPVIEDAPEDITVECIEDVPAMISLDWTDNCDDGGSVLGEDSELVGGACGGTITRTWNVMDECGNPAATQTQIITVDDTTAPVIEDAPEDITVECIEDVPTMISLDWTDNCDDGGSVLGEDSELVGGACGGTITRTWNVMDECGNPAATQTQIITVDDTTAPVIEDAPEDITVECIEDVPTMISLAWTDNCDDGGSVLGEDSELVGGACGGTITRTWNVMDECGNPAATQTQIITVDDTTAPVIEDAPEDITVECIEDVPAMISLDWTDNCDDGGSVLGEDSELVGGACGGTITRTWNVMDECGNPAATQTQIITVDDTTAPVIEDAPEDITVECIEDVPTMISLDWTDNCDDGGSVLGEDSELVGGACGGTITRTWNVMDECGNPAATQTQIITVDDTTAPVIEDAPEDITVECIEDVPAMISLDWTDNCDDGGSVLGEDSELVGGACGGTITRTWNVMDECGNPAATQTQIITVDDTTAPVIEDAPEDITVECIEDVPAMISLAWTDNCDDGGSVLGEDSELVGGACGGTITRTWNVMDECGNPAATQTQIITVDDTTAPVIEDAPEGITVECIEDVPAMISLDWTDNCDDGGSVLGEDSELVGGACGGTITRTWNVMDECGNPAATQTQIITVDDTTAPVIEDAPEDITVECIEDVPAMISLDWTDNCDDGGSVLGEDSELVGGACGGTITRTWNVMDECGNPAATQTQIITVDDTTAPVIEDAPEDITVECIEDVPAMISLDWTDNCDDGGSVLGEDSELVGGACGGTITRTWNVMDECGNPAATQTQIITVDDTTAPVIEDAPEDITVECIEDVPAMISLAWTDNCDDGGSVLGEDSELVGGACGGTITRTWNVMDECGNPAATQTQIITVDDTTAPVIEDAPEDITVECIEDVPAMISLDWTDNCDDGGSVLGEDSELVGGACGGTITRTWNVMDECGNPAATQTQIITVDDTTAPVIEDAPEDITVECIEDVPAMISLDWTDNCDDGGSVLGEDSELVGGACGGTITRTWNVMDECGNPAATQTQIITVDDTTAPVIEDAPEDITVECIEDVPAMISLDWTDNCDDGGSVLGEDSELVGGACGGTITRTWNVMDECGNPAATQTQIITVDDTTAPVIEDAPEDITVECIEDVPAMISLDWTDNCDDGGSVLGEDSELVGGACGGTITRTWNVMDECGNPAATQTQIITVDDTTAPVIEDAPEDITVECIEDVPTMISLDWTDNCDDGGSVLGEDSELVGGACGGTITRTWNVMDECGNPAATQTQIITVDDTTAPVIEDAPEDITVECIEDVPTMISLDWTDNCDDGGSVLGEDSELVGGACGGTITRTWNVMDECGNPAATQTQIITVDDTTAPVIEDAPEDITVECIEDVPAMISLDWTDNCDDGGSVLGEDSELVGGACGGTITRTWNVMDECGNPAATQTQIITVDDTTAPEIQLPVYDDTVCEEDVPASLTATWKDNCADGGDVIAYPELSGQDECSMTYSYIFEVEDDCGNPVYEEIFITREIDLVDNCETIFAYADNDISTCFLEDDFNRWGWTNHLTVEDSYDLTLYAGAGQCDRNKGAVAGTATIDYFDDMVTVTYEMVGYTLTEAHVYIGCTPYPLNNGKPTVAPGQYNFNPSIGESVQAYQVGPIDVSDLDDVYVIVHGVACEIVCQCTPDENGEIQSSFDGSSATCDDSETASNGNGNGNGNGKPGKKNKTSESSFSASPVPFNDKLTLKYDFEYTSNKVEIQVYDLSGRLLRTYHDKKVTRGDTKELDVDFALKANQVYIIRMQTDREVLTKNVVSSKRK